MTERRQQALPLNRWPAADRRAWAEALVDDGLLGDNGAASHHADSIQTDFTRRYGYFLGFALRCGALAQNGPAATVTRETVESYIAELQSYAGSVTVHRHVYKMMRVAEYIAPERDWAWLRHRARQLSFLAQARDKRPRIVTSDRLVKLGLDLMERARRYDTNEIDAAVLYRDGLMIAVLALCPIRRGNLTNLRIGWSILRQESSWSIAIPAMESKSGRAYHAGLPDLLTEVLDRFIEVYRPLFSRPADFLWPSKSGGGLSASRVYIIVATRTKAAFGLPIGPHLFRDCATTTIAMRAGREMGTAVALLGHRDPKIIDKHYNQAGMIEAIRRYHDLLHG